MDAIDIIHKHEFKPFNHTRTMPIPPASAFERPMDRLVRDLKTAFDQHGKGEIIREMLETYASTHDDWKDYAHFCPHHYSRNLVEKNDKYELIVICWGENHVSPIHNHEGQRCWMGVLEGQLQETYFIFKDTQGTRGTGPLEQTETNVLPHGDVGYITDDIALHVIRPANSKRAVSLHLYSYPISECNVYCPSSGTITRKKTGYFTEYKKLSTPCAALPDPSLC